MNETEPVGTVTLCVLAAEAQWDALETEWSELFAVSPQAGTPLRFDWLRTWWRIYGPSYGLHGGGLYIITVWRGTQLIGVLPLYEGMNGGRAFGMRRLGFISTGEAEYEETCADYLNIMCRPGEEGICIEAVSKMFGELRWDQLELLDIPENSPLIVLGEAGRGRRRLEVFRRGHCPIANLVGGFEAYLKRLSSNTRQQARRLLRAAERANATFELADKTNALEFYSDLVRLHQDRWTSEGKPGCFSAPRFTEFHKNLVMGWISDGIALLARLSVEGQIIAVLYGFVTGTKFDFYQSGIKFSRDGGGALETPGTTAHLFLMSRLVDRGVTHYDFLRGSSAYKERLATEQVQLYSLHSTRLTPRSVVWRTAQHLRRGAGRVAKFFQRKQPRAPEKQ